MQNDHQATSTNKTKISRVLVFPSCNEPGLEIIDALHLHPRIEVWGGASIEPESDPSLPLLGGRYDTLPSLGTPEFRETIEHFCSRNGIEYFFPTMDAVVAEAARWNGFLKVIGPERELANLVLSKTRVYDALRDVIPVPRAFDADEMDFPAFAKPDTGSGSRGARKLTKPEEFEAAVADGLLIQEYLPGKEYTVDCIGDVDGKLIACGVRQRLSYSEGIAKASICVRHPQIEDFVRAAATRLPISGPWFAQFREDREGLPRLLEINARVGGSSGATRLSGINIPLMALLSSSGMALTAPRQMNGVSITRRLDRRGTIDDFDMVIWDLDDTLVHSNEIVDPQMVGWLYRFKQAGKAQALVTRNIDPHGLIARTQLPDMFQKVVSTSDKLSAVRELLVEMETSASRTIMINDSGSEKIVFEKELPSIRTISPDAVCVLRH